MVEDGDGRRSWIWDEELKGRKKKMKGGERARNLKKKMFIFYFNIIIIFLLHQQLKNRKLLCLTHANLKTILKKKTLHRQSSKHHRLKC